MSTANRTTTNLVAAAWGAATAAVVYAGLRAGQKLFFPGEDPALASWTVHAAFTWRAFIALYAGGLLAFVFRRALSIERAARLLPSLVLAAGIALTLQALLLP